MPDYFNAIGSCLKKEYTYRIYNSRIRERLSMSTGPGSIPSIWTRLSCSGRPASFVGTHDFAAVRSVGTETRTTVRTVHYFDIQPQRPDSLTAGCAPTAFCYNMVRAMVGTCVYAAEGKLSPEDIPAILEARNRTAAGPTAPPGGLYMTNLWYHEDVL